jgi:hypothetical protein
MQKSTKNELRLTDESGDEVPERRLPDQRLIYQVTPGLAQLLNILIGHEPAGAESACKEIRSPGEHAFGSDPHGPAVCVEKRAGQLKDTHWRIGRGEPGQLRRVAGSQLDFLVPEKTSLARPVVRQLDRNKERPATPCRSLSLYQPR